MRTIRVLIQGLVQGVGFRSWIRRMAQQRGLYGWVRNRREGGVEAVFHGEEVALDSILHLCRQGPPMAFVEKVDVDDAAAAPTDPEFRKLPTV